MDGLQNVFTSHLPPQGTPILCPGPHFQEEAKEEQTAMVPPAIALRRCRHCMVLVSGSGTSWRARGKAETDRLLPQRLGLTPQPPRSRPRPPTLIPDLTVGLGGASVEPNSLCPATPAGPALQ